MKTQTAVQNIIERLKELRDLHSISGNSQERISRGKYVFAIQVAEKELETEKQQHEQTAINITNVLMDALDNPKGGKFSVEDEFNKYWDNKYTTKKETLK